MGQRSFPLTSWAGGKVRRMGPPPLPPPLVDGSIVNEVVEEDEEGSAYDASASASTGSNAADHPTTNVNVNATTSSSCSIPDGTTAASRNVRNGRIRILDYHHHHHQNPCNNHNPRNNHHNNREGRSVDRTCPICLCRLPWNPWQIKTLDCCGHSFCRQCLKGGGADQYHRQPDSSTSTPSTSANLIVDSCPMCRCPIVKRTLKGQIAQAKRLIDGTGTVGGPSSSLDHGIAILETILQNAADVTVGVTTVTTSTTTMSSSETEAHPTNSMLSSTSHDRQRQQQRKPYRREELYAVLPDVRLTLARALCKKDTPDSLHRALLVLQTMVDESSMTSLNTNTRTTSSFVPPASVTAKAMKVGGFKTGSSSGTSTKGPTTMHHYYNQRTMVETSPRSKWQAQAYFVRGEVLRKQLLQGQGRGTIAPPRTGPTITTTTIVTDDDGTTTTTIPPHEQQEQQQQQQEQQQQQQEQQNRQQEQLYQQQQEAYRRAVQCDPYNAALLLACARRMTDFTEQLDLYRQIVAVNKYHVVANLWLANYYRQQAMEMVAASTTTTTTTGVTTTISQITTLTAATATTATTSPSSASLELNDTVPLPPPSSIKQQQQPQRQKQHQQQHQQQQQLNTALTCYYACVVRAEFKAQSVHDKTACLDYRVDIQTNYPTFYNDAITKRMDRISAAYVPA